MNFKNLLSLTYYNFYTNNQHSHLSKIKKISNIYDQNFYKNEILIHAETQNYIIRIYGIEFPTSMGIKKRSNSTLERSFTYFHLAEDLNPRRFTAIGAKSEVYVLDLDRHHFVLTISDDLIVIEKAKWVQSWSYSFR